MDTEVLADVELVLIEVLPEVELVDMELLVDVVVLVKDVEVEDVEAETLVLELVLEVEIDVDCDVELVDMDRLVLDVEVDIELLVELVETEILLEVELVDLLDDVELVDVEALVEDVLILVLVDELVEVVPPLANLNVATPADIDLAIVIEPVVSTPVLLDSCRVAVLNVTAALPVPGEATVVPLRLKLLVTDVTTPVDFGPNIAIAQSVAVARVAVVCVL